MKKRIRYSDEPMGKVSVIEDFLPPPDQLVLKEEKVKVTIALKKASIDFFKKEAKKNNTSYQKMMREVIDWYASYYRKSA
jgi:predicted DNA binding CopG/RHH family protein